MTIMDPFILVGKHMEGIVGNSYVKLVQYSPKSFGALYALGEAYEKLPIHSPVYWANGKLGKAMEDYLLEHSFDCIVMTHMFPAQMLSHLAQNQCDLPKTILIATDYTCIPFFGETACDYYGIPTPDLEDEFASKGIPREKILAYGIPVSMAFTEAVSRVESRETPGWSGNGKYILLSGGSMGAGQIMEAVAVLKEFLDANQEYQLTIICGSNQKLYERITEQYSGEERIHILGYTDKMAVYLKAADVFITKPGGLSSTEAAVCGIPLIHLSPIPGCETSNAQYFSGHGMSLYVSQPGQELLDALDTLRDGSCAESMIQAQRKYISTKAAASYCDFIESICAK